MKFLSKKTSLAFFLIVGVVLVGFSILSHKKAEAAPTCYSVTTQFANILLSYSPAPHTVCTVGSGSYFAPTCTVSAPSLPACVNGLPGPGNNQIIGCVLVPTSDCGAISVTVAPPSATVSTGEGQQFLATVDGSANQNVTWDVNGVVGGNATVGTIDPTGLYTAPASVPSPATVTVTATSVADPTASGSASVTINLAVPPPPITGTIVVDSVDASGNPLSSSWDLTGPSPSDDPCLTNSCSGTSGNYSSVTPSADWTIDPTGPVSGYTFSGCDPSYPCSQPVVAGAVTTFKLVWTASALPPPPAAPTVTLTANPASVTAGNPVTLTWSSTNATSCSAPSWTASTTTSGAQSVTPASSQTYTMICTGPGGNGSGNALVTVNPAAGPVTITINSTQPVAAGVPVQLQCTGGTGVGYSWGSPGATTGSGSGSAYDPTYSSKGSYTVSCKDSAGDTTTATVQVVPDCTISVSPSSIVPPELAALSWSCPANTAVSCTITNSSGTAIVNDGSTSSTIDVSPSGAETYTLSCTANNGLGSAIPSASATLNVNGPGICETNPNAPGCPPQ
jgi:hypothetical protein